MLLVLLLLGALFSWLTFGEQHPEGAAAARQLTTHVLEDAPANPAVLIVARDTEKDTEFAISLRESLEAAGAGRIEVVHGQPADARRALESLDAAGAKLHAIACNEATSGWSVFSGIPEKYPALGDPRLLSPRAHRWPAFLKRDNLLNIANQIAVIAIVAIGMTMVILTAGIDLSVGSLIAFSAVVCTWCIREFGGGLEAGAGSMILSAAAAILVCALLGGFSGTMITAFSIPPFITTLAMMLVASGLAFIVAEGQSIYQLPDEITWLGRGANLGGIPNAVVLMVLLYLAAQAVMTRTLLGRYIYAVGGNREAAFLSGVPVKRVLLVTYILCGALAGLGGVILASQLKSGSPTYGLMYELYVIAAVVVGGTSLSGGRGKIFGTLIGAFIIAVIQNGMNLTGIESYTQKVVLGLVILGAVLLDRLKAKVAQTK